MTVTLVLPTDLTAELEAAVAYPLETAAVLLVSVVEAQDDFRLLGRELHWVDEAAYSRREADSLSIQSHGYVHALARAEQIGATPVWLHTHPGVELTPTPSKYDKIVDEQLADLFRLRSGSPYYGALILSQSNSGMEFSGHLQRESGRTVPIDRMWVVGDRFRLIQAFGVKAPGLSATFDRNVRAFGSAVQDTLGQLHVGVVGCGGTGSAVAEQAVRLGVRHVTLIDPDDLSVSNITRVYGSTPYDIGKPKVDVLSDHLARISSDVRVSRIDGSIIAEPIAKRLLNCDVIFGCTDDNAGRLILSRIGTYFLLPVIDCGVLLTSSNEGELSGIHGRITTLVPGQGCLVCRGRIDLSRAAAERLKPEERARRVDEGYAPALGNIEPAVITFTTAVSAAAVSELIERLVGYGPEPRPSEILLRYHEREISTNQAFPREGHYCHPMTGKIGIGMTDPFLEQTWPT